MSETAQNPASTAPRKSTGIGEIGKSVGKTSGVALRESAGFSDSRLQKGINSQPVARPPCCSAACYLGLCRGQSHACPVGVCVNPAKAKGAA